MCLIFLRKIVTKSAKNRYNIARILLLIIQVIFLQKEKNTSSKYPNAFLKNIPFIYRENFILKLKICRKLAVFITLEKMFVQTAHCGF